MRRASVNRRQGFLFVVDVEGLASATVTSRLDTLGTGYYQVLVILGVGLALCTECIEMGSVAPMNTALSRTFALDTITRSQLPLMTFAGFGIGMACAGPFADRFGRKGVLFWSLLGIIATMAVTALLPLWASVGQILLLRFSSGFAAAIQVPAGVALAVESCPVASRGQAMFVIMFLGSFGYLIEAFGVQGLMPHFGESEEDHWRKYCMFTASAAVLSLPFVAFIYESPCFLAVRGEADKCIEVLDGIARWNGKPPLRHMALPEPMRVEQGERHEYKLANWAEALGSTVMKYGYTIILLCIIDGSRTFFTWGSSYLWKDLVVLVDSGDFRRSAQINVIASFTPLVGLIIAGRLVHFGVRPVTFCTAAIAAVGLGLLTNVSLRTSPLGLLILMMMVKLTYGVLVATVTLMKVEMFPTEVRVGAFSFISAFAKVLSAYAPTLLELLKGSENATSWTNENLTFYILLMLAAVTLMGVLSVFVPGDSGDGVPLKDLVEQKHADDYFEEKPKLIVNYGATRGRGRALDTDANGREWSPAASSSLDTSSSKRSPNDGSRSPKGDDMEPLC